MSRHLPARLRAGAVALLLSAACNRGPGSVHVVSVRVADSALAPALRDAGLDTAALEAKGG